MKRNNLERENFPSYQVFYFPNLFRVTPKVINLLQTKVLRNGQVAIFGPGTGITDGTHLNTDGASRLLGVPMELLPRSCQRHVIMQGSDHPISRELRANTVYGDSLVYGPVLVPQFESVPKSGGTVLGWLNASWFLNRAGLFIKENGPLGAAGNGKPGERGPLDYAVVWTGALPMPSDVLRSIARYAGCNIWCEEDDVIYASDSLVAIHSTKPGPRKIRLPSSRTVYDAVTDELIGENIHEVSIDIRAPETRIYYFK